ncbi:LuxS/MPP-like metallohydrolase [Morchella conica CCBAS932]|uniref:Cytochrome b-c1 complex subunit 2, mitochondrial n=1 Tax=Morchella conica CCBAS932 TaxID=1392247 RepID=A0A3N4KYC0_9PEZI|nr:LuxS/MPP-like metallohydrolase [Morchella conica CCBAS932]
MFARTTISRGTPQWLSAVSNQRRGMAAAVANPFHYSVADATGIKVTSRDDGGPTTSLAIVARGGSRYESAPGVAHALEKFAFKSTTKRSSLRLQRESELLGGTLSSSLSKENIVLRANFLRDDLPYFVEALGEVLTKTKYTPHEFDEEVSETISYELHNHAHTASSIALETAHNVAFHNGLGSPTVALTKKYLNDVTVPSYAASVYTRGNIAIVASGAPQAALEKWTKEFLADVPAGNGPSTTPAKYYGGENRVYTPVGNALTIAFPGSAGAPKFQPEYTVLAYLLGGQSTIKWSTGSSLLSQTTAGIQGVSAVAKHSAYTDAGLLHITISGPASALKSAGTAAVKAINELANVKAEDVKKAIAQAKYDVLAAIEDRSIGLEVIGQAVIASGSAPQVADTVKGLEGVTLDAVKKAVKSILGGKATYAAVGDVHMLPYAEELGLKV